MMSRLKVDIRRMNDEWGVVKGLDRLAFPKGLWWPEDVWSMTMEQPDSRALVAVHNGRVVGYVLYENTKQGGLLVRIAVNPIMQRRQVGRQLLERVRQRIKGDLLVAVSGDARFDGFREFLRCCDWTGPQLLESDEDSGVTAFASPGGAEKKRQRGEIPASLARRNRMFPI